MSKSELKCRRLNNIFYKNCAFKLYHTFEEGCPRTHRFKCQRYSSFWGYRYESWHHVFDDVEYDYLEDTNSVVFFI